VSAEPTDRCDECGAVDVGTIEVRLGADRVNYCRECWMNMDESAPEPAPDFDRNACPGCGGNCATACR